PVILNGGVLGGSANNLSLSNAAGGGGAPNGTSVPSLIVLAPSTIQLDDIPAPGGPHTLTISGIVSGNAPLNVLGFDGSRTTSPIGLTSALVLSNPNNEYSG